MDGFVLQIRKGGNMKRIVTCLAAALFASAVAATRPDVPGRLLILNEDNDHFFKYPSSYMDVAHLEAYVDQLAAGGHVTHIHFCPTGGRASFDSKTWEPIWRGLDEYPPERTWFLYHRWATHAKMLHDKGIDPYAVWIRRCRERGISPWLAPRMNDVHDAAVSLTRFYRSTTFWRTHREYRLYPTYDKPSWYHHQFNYAHEAVRDDAYAMLAELFERYDFDGLCLTGNAWFPRETAEASAPVLTAFMRKVRRLADAWEKTRGHRIGLATQASGSPEDMRRRGFDVGLLAREGVFDTVICATRTNGLDVPVEAWRKAFAGRPVKLVAGAYECMAFAKGEARFGYEAAMYRGWADVMAARGADGFHFWNLPYYPQEQAAVAEKGLDPVRTRNLPRTYVTIARGRPPFTLAAPRTVETVVGTGTNGIPSVVLGFRGAPPSGLLSVSLNGVACVWEREEFIQKYRFEENRRGREFETALACQGRRYFFPPGSVRAGTNVVAMAATSERDEVIYFALHLEPEDRPTKETVK